MKKFRLLWALMPVSLIMVCLASCSDSKTDEDDLTPPEVKINDVLERDFAKGSISQQDFDNKVMGKVWYYGNRNSSNWVDSDGNTYDYLEYAPSGWTQEVAFYFDKEKYVNFYHPNPGQQKNFNSRNELTYSYNPATGFVYASNGQIPTEEGKALFYIESVTDNQMVIHQLYSKIAINEGDEAPEYNNMYCRYVLQSATDSEAQKDWWSVYLPD